ESLSPARSSWVRANEFIADSHQILRMPGEDGQLALIALGLGSDGNSPDPWCLAALAKSLPRGRYCLADDSGEITLSAIGWALSQYEFDRYKTRKNRHGAVLVVKDQTKLPELATIIGGITMVRDLVNSPSCDLGPGQLSQVMQDLAQRYGADFNETVGDDLVACGFNAIHAVGRAAKSPPRLLDMTWGRTAAPKLTLIGKGVCFDSGGLDLKAAGGMRLMKKDMGGAAHVLGLARMIMETGLDVRLRVLVPAVENNISGDAFRPGDIIKTYKGTTVEVDNTDAEGRLVLCDALALASEDDPELMLDYATLTGAARVAMGPAVVPFFTDSDDIAHALMTCSDALDDPVWRLPLYQPYMSDLNSNNADLDNVGSGPYGGAIMAALFLKHFVGNPEKWVHFDVFAWNLKDQPGRPKGGEAMAFRAIYRYLKHRFGTLSAKAIK
ncbi:MAG: leucyl aminopeptidase family protein, partial [Alphaproteobacteria bacterium]|nr:leucyl aminopeptidase family protein [Alphaproteobacteria bacterium]